MKKFLGLILFLLISILFIWKDLPHQDPSSYFNFGDQLRIFNIPHFTDVISNLVFLIAGLIGIIQLLKVQKKRATLSQISAWVLSLSSLLLCFASGYFHWTPMPETLVWDRLPLSLCFASMIMLLLSDRLNEIGDKILLPLFIILILGSPLLALGTYYGYQDVRPYVILQLSSILVVIYLFLVTKKNKLSQRSLFFLLLFYVLAKAFEVLDHSIFDMTGFLSGHNLKHFSAGLAIALFSLDFRNL